MLLILVTMWWIGTHLLSVDRKEKSSIERYWILHNYGASKGYELFPCIRWRA